MNDKLLCILISFLITLPTMIGCSRSSTQKSNANQAPGDSEKQFKIPGNQIKPLAEGHGGCFATDMITVEGHKVGYMYREEPDFREDSGWRFFSGKESQEYVDDPNHIKIYDVNTIANYDPTIIPLLDAPVGSAYERDESSGKFVQSPVRNFQ